jgi:diamine N-acetyltransferase
MKNTIASFGDGVVVLRLIEENDLKTILDWRNRDDARIWFKSSESISYASHRAWFDRYLQKDDDYFFLVEKDKRPVAQCSIYNIDRGKGFAEIGRFLVAPDQTGNGYVTRCCAELVRFGINDLNMSYLFLEVLEQNAKAMRIYTRCGFIEESRSGGMVRMGLSRGGL